MEIFFVVVIAFLASLTTFFSGFGLGTLLMPAMAFFFPLEVAVAVTAVVHFLTNIFKLSLTYRQVQWPIAFRFGVPAFLSAILGAFVLQRMGEGGILFQWSALNSEFTITLLKTIISILIVVFVMVEWIPGIKSLSFGKDKLIFGGLLSGFFGGLAGFQGALRSMFLIRFGLSKEGYIATGVVIACLIDLSRMTMYSMQNSTGILNQNVTVLAAATLSAFTGAYAGNRWLKKVTLASVQRLVGVCLILFAVALGSGLI